MCDAMSPLLRAAAQSAPPTQGREGSSQGPGRSPACTRDRRGRWGQAQRSILDEICVLAYGTSVPEAPVKEMVAALALLPSGPRAQQLLLRSETRRVGPVRPVRSMAAPPPGLRRVEACLPVVCRQALCAAGRRRSRAGPGSRVGPRCAPGRRRCAGCGSRAVRERLRASGPLRGRERRIRPSRGRARLLRRGWRRGRAGAPRGGVVRDGRRSSGHGAGPPSEGRARRAGGCARCRRRSASPGARTAAGGPAIVAVRGSRRPSSRSMPAPLGSRAGGGRTPRQRLGRPRRCAPAVRRSPRPSARRSRPWCLCRRLRRPLSPRALRLPPGGGEPCGGRPVRPGVRALRCARG